VTYREVWYKLPDVITHEFLPDCRESSAEDSLFDGHLPENLRTQGRVSTNEADIQSNQKVSVHLTIVL